MRKASLKTNIKAHVKAISNVFELSLIAGLIALLADTGWVYHDASTNGISVWYIAIGSGLGTATVLTLVCIIRHHNNAIKNGFKTTLKVKLAEQRTKISEGRIQRRHLKALSKQLHI